MLRIDKLKVERAGDGAEGYQLTVIANLGAGPQLPMVLTHNDDEQTIAMNVSGDYGNNEWQGVLNNIPADWFSGYSPDQLSRFVCVVDGVPQPGYRGGVIIKKGNYPNNSPANRQVVNSLEVNSLNIERDMANLCMVNIAVDCTCVNPPDFAAGPVSVQQDPDNNHYVLMTEALPANELPEPVDFSPIQVDMSPLNEANFLHWIIWDSTLGPINFNDVIEQSGGAYLEP